MTRSWLLAMWASGFLMACATTSGAQVVPPSCEQGAVLPCAEWGEKLLRDGDTGRAIEAFGKSCAEGNMQSCLKEGRLRKEVGDLVGAEAPLNKVYASGDVTGAMELAKVHDAHDDPMHAKAAEQLRREAPAFDKPDTEVVFALRMMSEHGSGMDLSFNLQPMAFSERRLGFGMNLVLASEPGLVEFNGFGGYQHYLTSWFVPYGRVMAGRMTTSGGSAGLNVGGEVGAKLCLEDVGHLNVAAGVSRGSGAYMSVGLGINGLIALAILMHL